MTTVPESTQTASRTFVGEVTTETETTALVDSTEGGKDDGHRSDTTDISDNGSDADNSTDRFYLDLDSQELADYVLNNGINGEDREAFLGDRYEEIQRVIDERYHIEMPTYEYEEDTYWYQPDTGYYYEGALTPESGINYYNGILETYYDLDMSWNIGVMRDMGFDEANYPYWIRSDGCKMLGNYIMVAADFGWEPRGTITMTSLGAAIVVDTGGGGWYWHDICVSGW